MAEVEKGGTSMSVGQRKAHPTYRKEINLERALKARSRALGLPTQISDTAPLLHQLKTPPTQLLRARGETMQIYSTALKFTPLHCSVY